MTSIDAGAVPMRRSDHHAAAVVFGILIVTGILLAPLETRSRVVGFEIVCTGLLGYVAGSAAAAVAVSAPLVGLAWVPLVEVLALSLLRAASRRQAESLVPAVVAQGLGGVVAFLFGILSALS